MNHPRGSLVRSRVVEDPGVALGAVLDEELTGYAVFEPQDALLFGTETRGVVTFEAGVPVAVYDATTDRGGRDALADLASPGPYSVEVYELGAEALASVHDAPELCVPPTLPAERLAGDSDLAARTREAAPADRLDAAGDDANAVEAFLADEERVEAIRERAREEARARAEEWGLQSQLRTDE